MKTTIKHLTIVLAFMMMTAAPALCFETIEGRIEGADCVVNKLHCAKGIDDPHLAMEKDFVLVTEEGDYFFMPNLRRQYKKSAFKSQVRVTGKRNGAAISVENFEVLKNNRFASVWNYTREMKDRNRR